MSQSNVIKLNDRRASPVNEESLLLVNLAQVLIEVVRQHGAHTTLTAVQGMIQEAQKQVRTERQHKPTKTNLPVSKRAVGGAK
jgi:hypothetical protein